jgi:hypothetical protein
VKSKSEFEIGETVSLDIDLLRLQRDSLLEVIEVLSSTEPHFIDEVFAFDREGIIENLEGLIHLCGGILDEAEL